MTDTPHTEENQYIPDTLSVVTFFEEIFAKIKSSRTAGWAVAIFSIFNWRLGKAVALNYSSGVDLLLSETILSSVIWCGFILFFIPIVHSIAEKTANNGNAQSASVGETARDINFAAATLIPFMPAGIILRALSASAFVVHLADLGLRFALLWNISSVIKKSYGAKRLNAFFMLFAPVGFITLWLTAIVILTALWALIKFL